MFTRFCVERGCKGGRPYPLRCHSQTSLRCGFVRDWRQRDLSKTYYDTCEGRGELRHQSINIGNDDHKRQSSVLPAHSPPLAHPPFFLFNHRVFKRVVVLAMPQETGAGGTLFLSDLYLQAAVLVKNLLVSKSSSGNGWQMKARCQSKTFRMASLVRVGL